MATGLDLFDNFHAAPRQKTGGASVPSRTEDELRQFEDVFGPLANGTGPRVDIAKNKGESSSANAMLVKGPMSESQLRSLYKDFADRYYKHRNQAPPVSFEQLALMIQSRRAQLQQRFPNCAVTVSVVIQNDKVIVKLRPVNEAGQRLG